MHDLRYAIRWIMRNKLFAIAIILTISIAIGANTAVFSIVSLAFYPHLPFEDSDRIITFENESSKRIKLNDYEEFWQHLDFFESIAGYKIKVWNFSGHGEPIRIPGYSVSASFLTVLKVQPAIGRNFTYEEDHSGSPFVVLISDEMWHAIFAADPQVLGKVIQLDGQPCEIIGVMKPDFKFPKTIIKQPQFWTTLGYEKAHQSPNSQNAIFTFGRLKPNLTIFEAQEKLKTIGNHYHGGGYQFRAKTLGDFTRIASREYRSTILLLVGSGVLLVLFIACANVASLLLSRAISRKREIAIRMTVGASRWRLVRQLLTESILLCSMGGIFGFVLAYWFRDTIKILLGAVYPVASNWFTGALPDTIHFKIFGFTALIAILTGILTGLTPALQASKTDLNSAMKEGRQYSFQDFRSRRFHNFFVVFQIAVALLLLTGAGLMVRTIAHLQHQDLGYDPSFTRMDVPLPYYKYPEPADWRNFSMQLLQRIQILPGIQQSAIESGGQIGIELANQNAKFTEDDLWVPYYCVTAGYFKALKAKLLSGRDFIESENENSSHVILVNESFARKYFSGKNPIGQRVHMNFDTPAVAEIIGVVRDIKQEIDTDLVPQIYILYNQQPGQWISVIVRGTFSQAAIGPLLSKQVWAIDSNQVVFGVYPMSELFKNATHSRRSIMFLLIFFALVAISLALIGIYSVISYSTNRQTQEIGIRMSLGAQKEDVIRMILKKATLLIFIGTVIGLSLSFALNRFLTAVIYGISRNDPLTYIAVSVLVIFMALLASVIPARRAAQVDPVVALRQE